MDGNAGFDAALAYLSRLTGEDVTLNQKLGLRSIQRVALASWARQANIAVRGSLINSGSPFSVRELLTVGGPETALDEPGTEAVSSGAVATPFTGLMQGIGIGIDIEDIGSLPEAADFREHPFYRDNFTPAEISYCVRQSNAAAAFCGTWAAKEAILKGSNAGPSLARLIDIEIVRDSFGRPTHPGFAISISHTPQTAVAMCMRITPPVAIRPAERPISDRKEPGVPQASGTKGGRYKALAALSVVIFVGLFVYWIMRSAA
jgi:phosphopantetheine--protein transferase-like protein